MDNTAIKNHAAGILSQSRIVAMVVAFCFYVPLGGAVAQSIGGWPGFVVWFMFWLPMAVVAIVLTRQYSNAILPTLCGIMVGITAPRPSDAWLTSMVGEALSRGLSIIITIAAVGLALTVFNATSKHHRNSTTK